MAEPHGRRGLRSSLIVCALNAWAASACANLSGLSGGNDAAAADAQADTSADATSVDSSDAASPLPGDASVKDAASEAPATGPWCSTHGPHTFCFDFDEVFDPTSGWNGGNVSSAGQVTRDDTLSSSPPASLRSTVANGMDPGCSFAIVSQKPTSLPSSVDVAFEVWPQVGDAGPNTAELISVRVSDGAGGRYEVTLYGGGPTPSTLLWGIPTAGGYSSGTTPLQPIQANAWTRVDLHVQYGSPWSVTLQLGATVQEQQMQLPGSLAITGLQQPNVSIDLGVVQCSGLLAFHGNYDNVTIDLQ